MTMDIKTNDKGQTALIVDHLLLADIDSDGFHTSHPEYQCSPEYPAFLERFTLVAIGALNAKTDFYQGTDEYVVVQEKETGRLFGLPQWQGGGKYGELYREDTDADDWGYESGHDNPAYDPDKEEDDEQNPYSIYYHRFVEVKESSIPAYEAV